MKKNMAGLILVLFAIALFMTGCEKKAQEKEEAQEASARQLVIRQRGEAYLSPDEIPELLDPEVPQQLLVSAFRRYRR